MTIKINSMKNLTDDLVSTYEKLRNKEITNEEAHAITRVAGAIISSCKVQLAYNMQQTKAIGPNAKMGFLELPDKEEEDKVVSV